MQTYAQLNDDGIVIGESCLSGPVVSERLVQITAADGSYLGKRWNGSAFVAVAATAGPVMSKYVFRQLLTDQQKLVWDNYDLLKTALGLTDQQYMMMRSFRADFEAAEELNLEEPLLINGLNAVASWGLQLDGQDVFTSADVARILAGQAP